MATSSCHLFTDAAFDPRDHRWHRARAGLAFEKHRWLVPTKLGDEYFLYTYGGRDGYGQGAQEYMRGSLTLIKSCPIVDLLAEGALPEPPFHVHVLVDTAAPIGASGGVESPARRVLTRYLAQAGRVWLCVVNRTLRTGLPVSDEVRRLAKELPRPHGLAPYHKARSLRVWNLLAAAPGLRWEGPPPEEEDELGIATLPDEQSRIVALRCFGEEAYRDAYLLVDPEPSLEQELREPSSAVQQMLRRLAREVTPGVSYPELHRLVNRCAYVVSTHGLIREYAPYRFYTPRDRRPALREIAGALDVDLRETERVEDLPGCPSDAATRGDVADVLGPEAYHGRTELELTDPRITRLDGLAGETQLRTLWLFGLGFLEFQSLARMRGLENLALVGIPLPDIAALAGLRELRSLSVQCEPRGGWGELRHLPWVEEFYINANQNIDTTGIAQLRALRALSISTIVEPLNLEPLRALPALECVMLFDVSVSDHAPLLSMPSLRHLHVDEGALPERILMELRARGVSIQHVPIFPDLGDR